MISDEKFILLIIFLLILAAVLIFSQFVVRILILMAKKSQLPKHKEKRNFPGRGSPNQEVNPTIFSARTVFPFKIFPNFYILQSKTLTIIKKKFFFSAFTETIPINDISGVSLTTGPFLASVALVKKIVPRTSIELSTMWKKDAIRLKEYLEGLILKEKKLIDIPEKLSEPTKKELIFEVGRDKTVEKEV